MHETMCCVGSASGMQRCDLLLMLGHAGGRLLSDFKPRTFDAGMYHVFANLAELAMQEIEAGAKGPLPEPDVDSACKFSRQSMSMQIMLPSECAPCCCLHSNRLCSILWQARTPTCALRSVRCQRQATPDC